MAYVPKAFGAWLEEVRGAMEELAGSLDPDGLTRVGFRLFKPVQPDIPAGARAGVPRESWTWAVFAAWPPEGHEG